MYISLLLINLVKVLLHNLNIRAHIKVGYTPNNLYFCVTSYTKIIFLNLDKISSDLVLPDIGLKPLLGPEVLSVLKTARPYVFKAQSK
ncbi:hypothetical protein GCM10023339_13850 [Alloalcanivorax gelatiniphagus]